MVAALAAPGLARAATVEVVVDQSYHKIVFAGGSGEVNTVSLGVVGELGDHTSGPGTYSVTDSTAPIVAGTGCSGGGPAGSTATCPLPRSAPSSPGIGGPFSPGVDDVFEINLGDGDDWLDSTALPAGDGGGGFFTVRAAGGPGADGLVDGPNHATFTPGPGVDTVTAGAGRDWAYASEGAADEADLYDLGPDEDTIDYSIAAYPVSVSLAGTAESGAAGEGDRILGAEEVRGGSAADRLTGPDDSPVSVFFDGFGGDDTIVGGPNRDFVYGGSGDDVIKGRDGNDALHGDGAFGPDGDDRIRGGAGADLHHGHGRRGPAQRRLGSRRGVRLDLGDARPRPRPDRLRAGLRRRGLRRTRGPGSPLRAGPLVERAALAVGELLDDLARCLRVHFGELEIEGHRVVDVTE